MATTETPSAAELVRTKLREDFTFYAENCLWIVNKDGKRVQFELNAAQRALEAMLAEQREAGLPQRALVLKARQVGISTYAQAKCIHRTTLNAYHSAIVVAHDLETGSKLYNMGDRMYKNLPDDDELGLRPPVANFKRSRFMRFGEPASGAWNSDAGLESEYLVSTAGEPEAGRGGTYRTLHGCFPGDTPILCADGRIKRADEVEVGERVLTHSGQEAEVSVVSTRPNEDPMVVVTPWLGGAIRLTPNHKVWVRPGEWRRADELAAGDWVAMPVRPITREITQIPTRQVERKGQTGGRQRKGGGEPIPLNEETGFAVGYYLAEGHIFLNQGKHPAGITFARDRDEEAYAARACAALSPWTGSRRLDTREGTRTVTETIYGSAAAEAIAEYFGRGENKRIPDWVFGAGEEFCRGLLLGYLAGDGSKSYDSKGAPYDCPKLTATSIRASLVTQARDLAASLGYGWASLRRKEAGHHYGRNCQEAWVACWNGDAARRLRADLGLPGSMSGRRQTQKYELEDGTVWLKLRKLEVAEPDEEVWDFEVDHTDHSFRTAHFAISNSELAFWPAILDKWIALLSGMPNDSDTLAIGESTANGFNEFKEMWDDAVEGRSAFLAFFWPWWKHEEYTLPFLNEREREDFRVGDTNQSPYAEAEPALLDPGPIDVMSGEHVPLTLEQLHWRRWTIANRCGGNLNKWNQEFPTVPEDAFLSTGSYVFEGALVRPIQLRAQKITPTHTGVIEASKREMRAGARGKVEVPVEPKLTVAERLMPGVSPDWKLWIDLEEDPQTKALRPPADGLYVIGVDVSSGVSEGEDKAADPARHAIEVIDHRTKEQVAEYVSRYDTPIFTEHVYLTAMFFNEAWLAVEITGGYGMPVIRTIVQDFRYRFPYIRKTHDRRFDSEQKPLGWDTRPTTKPILLALGEKLIQGDDHGIKSPELAGEMLTYVRKDTGKTEPERGKFSDRLMAWLIAQQVAQEMPMRVKKTGRKQAPSRKPFNPITGY